MATNVALPAADHYPDAPAVVAHVEDQHHTEIRTPAEPKKPACEVTVTTDATEYRSGDVISGTVVVNCSVPVDAKVHPAPAPAPAPAARVPRVPFARCIFRSDPRLGRFLPRVRAKDHTRDRD